MKNQIEIIEGHNGSSYFWIMPVKVIDYNKPTDDLDNVERYQELEISIEKDNIEAFLFPILLKYFDDNLIENIRRNDNQLVNYYIGDSSFEWNLTYNYYTMESMKNMVNEIEEIIELLKNDYHNQKLDYIKDGYNLIIYLIPGLNTNNIPNKVAEENIIEGNKDIIIDFYERFNKYITDMIKRGEEAGYKLISFMGP